MSKNMPQIPVQTYYTYVYLVFIFIFFYYQSAKDISLANG